MAPAPAGAAGTGSERVSTPDPGTGELLSDGASLESSISDDGRYVAYVSQATNLVTGDTNGRTDAFVLDRTTGGVERVSLPDPTTGNTEGNGDTTDVSIRGDGRYVAFQSVANNLVVGDTNMRQDIFVHDRVSGSTELVSVDALGIPNGPLDWFSGLFNSYTHLRPYIADNGRYVGWTAARRAWGLPTWSRVFVRDLQTGTTEMVSVDSDENVANNFNYAANVSVDGRYVSFSSNASNLASGTGLGKSDAFVRDRVAGTTERVSVNDAGDAGNKSSVQALSGRSYGMSADGCLIAFRSQASNLVPNDTNSTWDGFVRDRCSGTTERISVAGGGAIEANGQTQVVQISLDGRYVAFQSMATNLDPADTGGTWDAYVHDRQTKLTSVVSVNAATEPDNGTFFDDPQISGDGSTIVWQTDATNLDVADTNAALDIYLAETAPALVPEPDVASQVTADATARRGETTQATVGTSNAGSAPASAPITTELEATTGATITGATGAGWNCVGTTCTSTDPIAPYSALADLDVSVDVDPAAPDTITVTATASCACADANAANDVASADLAVTDNNADYVSVSVSGALNYHVEGFALTDDLTVTTGASTSVAGTGTLSSPTGGTATVTLNVSENSIGWSVGSVRIEDPSSGVNSGFNMFSGQIHGAAGTCTVNGARTVYVFRGFSVKKYRVTFEVTDNNDCTT